MLGERIAACRLCAGRFAATVTGQELRLVVWFRPDADIGGGARRARVQGRGVPFEDARGERLRGWMGIGREAICDLDRVAVVPMAFCFPGYDARGAGLAPPPVCAATWRGQVMAALAGVYLTLLVWGCAGVASGDCAGRLAGGAVVRTCGAGRFSLAASVVAQ